MEYGKSYRIWHKINGDDPEYQSVRCPDSGKRMLKVMLNRDFQDHRDSVKFGVEVYEDDAWKEVLYDGKTIYEVLEYKINVD